LQKRPIILSILLAEATPYLNIYQLDYFCAHTDAFCGLKRGLHTRKRALFLILQSIYTYISAGPAFPSRAHTHILWSQKSPAYAQKNPIYPQKSPVYPQKRPRYPQKSPKSDTSTHISWTSTTFARTHTHYVVSKEPYIRAKEPYISTKEPYI